MFLELTNNVLELYLSFKPVPSFLTSATTQLHQTSLYNMPYLRPASLLRSAARPATVRPALFARPQVRFATQDYGSGEGNPAGEKPQAQGQNPSENIEHPGPPPPKVAQGKSSSSPNEDSGSSSGKSSSSSSTSKSAEQSQSNDGASKTGGGGGKSSPQPKILNENPPAADSEDVKQHNQEMDQRAEKAHEQVSNEDTEKDKVSKSFWAGQGGRDREP
ncbi:hypothetical protein N0V94_002190 [Neodidymelliopsis sp. IMI 364377]|nr:hypothetical protein N0V94_002190 [Neodidymelliopsis sp. IMI 364377]